MPSLGIANGTNDGGQMQFWQMGFPYQYLFPPSAPTTLLKTIDSILISSVKSISGVPIASVKTRDTVAN